MFCLRVRTVPTWSTDHRPAWWSLATGTESFSDSSVWSDYWILLRPLYWSLPGIAPYNHFHLSRSRSLGNCLHPHAPWRRLLYRQAFFIWPKPTMVVAKDKVSAWTGNRIRGPIQDPVHYPLSYRFTLSRWKGLHVSGLHLLREMRRSAVHY